jgi:hypothetical protein
MNRAFCVTVFAALTVTSQITTAQTFSITPQHELSLTAAPGALTTESLTFTNNSDKELSISTSYTADPTIGVDLPKTIVLQPNEQFDVIISFLGEDVSARGEITLTSGDLTRRIDLRGNISETETGGEDAASASVYEAGNKEIEFTVGPNPVVSDMNVSVRNAASVKVSVHDLSGKLMTSSKSNNFIWNASSSNASGTYFVTVRGITNSGKPFNETRKVAVN